MCECNGEFVGGVVNELFYSIFILYIAGVGINPGKQTWLRKVHGGWVSGVTLTFK